MARTNNLTNFLTDVASAIKEKTGDSTAIPASQFDTKIASIPTGGTYQEKNITITENGNMNLLPDSGYDALSNVRITTNVSGGSTGDATATANDIVAPKTAYSQGAKITGNIELKDSITYINPTVTTYGEDDTAEGIECENTNAVRIALDTNSTTQVKVPYSSIRSIETDAIAANIRLGTTILGVEGNLAPDKPDQSKTVTPTTSQQVITPDTGYELASVTVNAVTSSVDQNITAENIKKDITILGVTGTLQEGIDTSDATATANDIISLKTAYANGAKITGNIPLYNEKVYGAHSLTYYSNSDDPTLLYDLSGYTQYDRGQWCIYTKQNGDIYFSTSPNSSLYCENLTDLYNFDGPTMSSYASDYLYYYKGTTRYKVQYKVSNYYCIIANKTTGVPMYTYFLPNDKRPDSRQINISYPNENTLRINRPNGDAWFYCTYSYNSSTGIYTYTYTNYNRNSYVDFSNAYIAFANIPVYNSGTLYTGANTIVDRDNKPQNLSVYQFDTTNSTWNLLEGPVAKSTLVLGNCTLRYSSQDIYGYNSETLTISDVYFPATPYSREGVQNLGIMTSNINEIKSALNSNSITKVKVPFTSIRELETNAIPSNIKSGVTILGVTGTVSEGVMTQLEYENALDIANDILGNTPYLPYTELQYITGDGYSYINTRTNIDTNGYMVLKVLNNDTTVAYGKIFGISNTYVLQQNDTSLTNYGVRYKSGGDSDFFNLDMSSSPVELKVTYAGVLTNFSTGTQYCSRNTIDHNSSIILFGMTGLEAGAYSKCRLYGFKIYDSSNQLTLDLIPVIRKADNAVCMYDKVSNLFYANSGNGSFIAGPEKE